MAIIKEKINMAGQEASYWKIISLIPNYLNSTANITLFGYESEAAKNSGEPYVLAEGVALNSTNFDAVFGSGGDIRAKAYLFIKTQENWLGAVDA